MKRLFIFVTLVFAMMCNSCEKANGTANGDLPNGDQQEEQQKPEEGFVVKGWNGEFVQQMAEAYKYFVENNKMPTAVNVEGLDYGRGKMVAASCKLLKKIIAEPETWQDVEVDFLETASIPDNEKNNNSH